MTIKSIALISETNAYESFDKNYYDEAPQGSTFPLVRIYKVENTDGPDQYFKQEILIGSYGTIEPGDIGKKFTEVVPETKTVTVFA